MRREVAEILATIPWTIPLFFGVVVIAANLAGVSNDIPTAGALTFLACRFIYAIVYMLGVPVVRTVAYLGGVIGTLIIASQLL